jgi:hypothetical protein
MNTVAPEVTLLKERVTSVIDVGCIPDLEEAVGVGG